MQLTQTELEWLIAEAAPLLEESAIQRVLETGERERVLQARRPGQTLLLEVVTDPETARIHLTPERGQQPGYPSSFTMLMRKWVQGMVIASVEMVPDDRIFVIRGDVVDPRWDPEVEPIEEEESPPRAEVALVVELMGRLTNLFVLGAGDQILGMERGDAVKGRELGVGDVWAPPPPPPGQTPQPNRWAEADLPPSEEAAVDGAPRSSYASAWFDEHLARWRREQLIKELRRALKRQVKRLRRLVKNVEGDLERAEDAQQWRRHGELLQSAYGKVERGTELVRVPDYYQEGMPEVEIPLDPSRSLQDNIDRYFKEYRRLHEALERIEARLLESMESLERAEEARGALEARAEDTLGELETWRDELRQEGILPEPRSHKRGPQLPRLSEEAALPDLSLWAGGDDPGGARGQAKRRGEHARGARARHVDARARLGGGACAVADEARRGAPPRRPARRGAPGGALLQGASGHAGGRDVHAGQARAQAEGISGGDGHDRRRVDPWGQARPGAAGAAAGDRGALTGRGCARQRGSVAPPE